LFDRRLQLNGAYFHYDYTNKQTLGNVIDPIVGSLRALVNIPKSKEDGVELSADLRLVDGLKLNASVLYIDSRVSSDFFNYTPFSQNASESINFKGEQFPFTPKWTQRYGARYDWGVTDKLSAFVSADYSHQTGSNAIFGTAQTPAGVPVPRINAYGLLDLTAGLETDDGKWRVEFWGRNVTNTYYWNSTVQFGDGIVRLAGMPATYGIGVHFRY
jgi:iron complex outermembrane recepter protein